MITLKKIDAYGQLLLMAGSILYILAQGGTSSIYCYYIVGSWQLTSFVIHALLRRKLIVVVCRNFYGFFLLVATISLLVCTALQLNEQLGLLLTGFLFLSPLMAVYYLLISFRELGIWQHRQFIQLR